MTTTKSFNEAAKLLAKHLDTDIPNLDNWTITQGGTGRYQITTPKGMFRIRPPDQWTADTIDADLEKLNKYGLGIQLSRMDKKPAVNGKKKTVSLKRSLPDNEMTPPVYPGDPSPDLGKHSVDVLVTPEMARDLLARDWKVVTSDGEELRQRPLDPGNVDHFAGLLRKKKFLTTHQGFAIGLNGSFLDGQHRAKAIELTGISAVITITYNVHPDEVLAFDGGRQRRASTKLSMRGYEHALTFGSAARVLHYFLNYELSREVDDDGGVLVGDWQRWNNIKVNDLLIDEVIDEHPGLYPCVVWAVENRRKALNPASVAAFSYLARRAWPAQDVERDKDDPEDTGSDLDKFLDAVANSIGIETPSHPARLVHQWLEAQPGRPPRWHREGHLYALIKAWNLHADPAKKPLKKLVLTNKFPLPYSPPE